MRALLDTHAWLWWLMEPERLGRKARALIGDPANELFLSAASCWEIGIKCRLGKLSLPEDPETFVPAVLARHGIIVLRVEAAHGLRVAGLPPHHNDPFDRLLVAQCQLEDLPIVTADRRFAPYGVDVIPAAPMRRPTR